ITQFLDWHHTHKAVLVGTGNLGSALSGYGEFSRHGMHILAAFDADPKKIGKSLNGIEIFPMDRIGDLIPELGIELAVLTVPSHSAQAIAEQLIVAGIKAIWNFTNAKLKVPQDIIVQKEDLSSGYAVLSVKIARSRK